MTVDNEPTKPTPCERHDFAGHLITSSCPDCGHAIVIHGGTESCAICRLELLIASQPNGLACSFCMFDERRPDDPDSQADLDVIVVINGHSTCLWHAGYAQGTPWTLKLAAIKER